MFYLYCNTLYYVAKQVDAAPCVSANTIVEVQHQPCMYRINAVRQLCCMGLKMAAAVHRVGRLIIVHNVRTSAFISNSNGPINHSFESFFSALNTLHVPPITVSNPSENYGYTEKVFNISSSHEKIAVGRQLQRKSGIVDSTIINSTQLFQFRRSFPYQLEQYHEMTQKHRQPLKLAWTTQNQRKIARSNAA